MEILPNLFFILHTCRYEVLVTVNYGNWAEFYTLMAMLIRCSSSKFVGRVNPTLIGRNAGMICVAAKSIASTNISAQGYFIDSILKRGKLAGIGVQTPRRRSSSSTVVCRAALSDFLPVALFFTPGLCALVYAYFKGKGNLKDGLSRSVT